MSSPKDQLTADNFKGESMLLEPDGVILHRDLQSREKLEDVDRQAAAVAEALKKNEKVDPILVIRIPAGTKRVLDGKPVDPGDYPVDGHGRTKGFRLAGRAKIPAVVRVGTWEDAVDASTSANVHHKAMPRSPEDKRRAVLLTLVNNPLWSDRAVSDHCGVGHDLPKRLRPEAEKLLRLAASEKAAAEGKDPKEAAERAAASANGKRKGKDGRLQAAKKKTARKPRGPGLDWKGTIDMVGRVSQFIDAAAEVTGERGKESLHQKTHRANRATQTLLKRWQDKAEAARKGK